MYVPYIKQEEPLRMECQHFLDCIRESKAPLTCGRKGLELVKILEASSLSLKQHGSPVYLQPQTNGHHAARLDTSADVRQPLGLNPLGEGKPLRPVHATV
jgi:hypothetical protein